MKAKQTTSSKTTRLLLSNSVTSTLATGFEFAFSLIVLPILATSLGKYQYGIWTLIGQSISFLVISDLGTTNAIGRFIARSRGKDDKELLQTLASTGLVVSVIMAALTFLLVFAISGQLPGWLGVSQPDIPIARTIFLISGFSLGLVLPLRLFDGILRGFQEYTLINNLRSTYTVLRGIAIIILVANKNLTLTNLAIGFALASILYYLGLTVAALRLMAGWRFMLSKDFLALTKEIFGMGTSTALMTGSSSIYREGIVLAAGPLLGAATAGVYGVVLTIIMRVSGLLSQIGNPLLTLASEAQARGEMNQLRSLCNGVLRVTFAFGVSGAAGLAVYGEPALRVWLGNSDWSNQDYSAGGTALTLMSIALAIGLPQLAARSLLQGVGKHWAVSWGFLAASLGGLALSVVLMRAGWGILGAAWGWAFVLLAQGLLIYPPMLLQVLDQRLTRLLRDAYLPGLYVGIAVWLTSVTVSALAPPSNALNLMLGVGSGLFVGITGVAIISQHVRNRLLGVLRRKS